MSVRISEEARKHEDEVERIFDLDNPSPADAIDFPAAKSGPLPVVGDGELSPTRLGARPDVHLEADGATNPALSRLFASLERRLEAPGGTRRANAVKTGELRRLINLVADRLAAEGTVRVERNAEADLAELAAWHVRIVAGLGRYIQASIAPLGAEATAGDTAAEGGGTCCTGPSTRSLP